jgi:hypothetical protein
MTTGRINQVTILKKAVAADRPEGRSGFITKRRRGRRSAVTLEARSHRRTTVNQNQLLDLLVDDQTARTIQSPAAQSQLWRELRRSENIVFKRPS